MKMIYPPIRLTLLKSPLITSSFVNNITVQPRNIMPAAYTGRTGQAGPSSSVPSRTHVRCPVCERVFQRPSERNRHISDSHLPPRIACQLCFWTGSRECSFEAHLTRHHPGNPGPHSSYPLYLPKPYIERILDSGGVEDYMVRQQLFSDVALEAMMEAAVGWINLWRLGAE
ncbi:hypothetical protein BC834DRAFT_885155 [Gloeopeniophorella convolvens]|nr:hypothetical protein BC834DRAFT_885155 [Gloeopeniophorella convolvens]